MSMLVLPKPSENLQYKMQGIWWLLSREDWTKVGEQKIDPVLGLSPIGHISYAKNHFAAQFMKRDRTETITTQISSTGSNNTNAVGGYDAYFGTYEVNEDSGKVAHTLIGSITPTNIGIIVSRDLRVIDEQLIIQLDTTTLEGVPITRTLIWKRIN
ncbi:MAG: lipocalin-like domain-containing protein [Bacteroidia bacterium]